VPGPLPFLEKSSLEEGFSRKICDHVSCRTPNDRCFVVANLISDEEIANIHMLCAFTARSFPVFLEENGTLVVLVNDVVIDHVTLGFHKVSRSAYYSWHEVVRSNYLGLGGAPGVELLLGGGDDWKSTSHG
jgi:hypothetical protein